MPLTKTFLVAIYGPILHPSSKKYELEHTPAFGDIVATPAAGLIGASNIF